MNAMIPVTVHADELDTIQRTARLLAVSGYFDAKGDTPMAIAQLATKILAGRELGFGPYAAARGIYIIKGNPSISANLMAAAVKGSGRYDYRVKELTDANCVVEFFELSAGKRESLGVSSFSAADAKKAGTQNMDRFPRNMLFARAMSNGVRFYTPDVFSGNAVYLPEELGASVDGDGNVVDVELPRRTVDAATGEILPVAPATPRSAPPMQPSVGIDGDMLFGTDAAAFNRMVPGANAGIPWYTAARETLTPAIRIIADDLLTLHRNNGGPCSPKAYGYLSGLLDSVIEQATGAEDAHRRVLTVLCQMDVTDINRPSATMVGRLLAYLATHIKDAAGNKVENPDYSQLIADAMVAVFRAAEAVGTSSLLEA